MLDLTPAPTFLIAGLVEQYTTQLSYSGVASHFTQPLAVYLNLQILPLHTHEVLLALTLYNIFFTHLSHLLSTHLLPCIYPSFSTPTKANWNICVVSFFPSTFISLLFLTIIMIDTHRWVMDTRGRSYGYTRTAGDGTVLSAGYAVWYLGIRVRYLEILGWE